MKNLFFLIFLLISLTVGKAQPPNKALLLIDIQEFYFPGGFSELVNPEEASENAALILQKFREDNNPVIHVQHFSEKQMDIYHNLAPLENEICIVKKEVNAFKNTNLKAVLDSLNISELVIAGMQTHMCVEAATRAASDYGYNVMLIEDACATKDLTWDTDTIVAEDVHNSTLNALKNYAKIMTASEWLKD